MDQISVPGSDVEPLSADWTVSFYGRFTSIDFHSPGFWSQAPAQIRQLCKFTQFIRFKYRSFWLQVVFSSTRRNVMGQLGINTPGLIHADWRGEYKICMSNTHACLRRVQTQDVRFTPEVGLWVGVCEEWAPEQFKVFSNDYHHLPSNNEEWSIIVLLDKYSEIIYKLVK